MDRNKERYFMSEILLINRRGKKRRTSKMRKNPTKRRRSTKRHHRMAVNPRRRRHHTRMRRNPRRRSSGGGAKGILKGTVMPAAIGAGGAAGLSLLMNMIQGSLPASMTSNPIKPLVGLAGAVGMGFAASKVMGRDFGMKVGIGAATVVLYQALQGYWNAAFPTMPLSGLGEGKLEYYSAGAQIGPLGQFVGSAAPANKVVQPMSMFIR